MEESFLQDLVLSVCILAAVQSLPLESEGFIQIIRNNRVAEDSVTVHPHADPTRSYTFTDPLGKRSFTVSGEQLAREGFCDALPLRAGVLWFYEKK